MKRSALLATTAIIGLVALGPGVTSASAEAAKYQPCTNGVNGKVIQSTWPGFPAGLTTGGPATESTVLYTNNSGHAIKDFKTIFEILTQKSVGNIPTGSFTVQLQQPDGSWKQVVGANGVGSFDTGTYQLTPGQVITIKLKVTATDQASPGGYDVTVGGSSALWDDDMGRWTTDPGPAAKPEIAPHARRGTCTQYEGATQTTFTVSVPPSPTASPSTPAPTASTPAATPSASPKPSLAQTGAGSALPIAGVGAVAVLAGGGVLFGLRRRKGTRS
jgi:LPXTG-motif cell wall-anchored protein